MNSRAALAICTAIILTALVGTAWAQQQVMPSEPERTREGVYEITLKTPDSRKIIVDELVRDRDLNPRALFRVKTGGYLAFEDDEWVDKLEFKVFDIPVTSMPQYQKFTNILVGINDKIWSIKRLLQEYDEISLRLMNICDRTRFPSLKAIDENIEQQLSIYKRLLVLRALIVNSMNRFVADRSCVDKFAQYKKNLERYSKRLTQLCKNFDRLKRKTLEAATLEAATAEETTQTSADDRSAAVN